MHWLVPTLSAVGGLSFIGTLITAFSTRRKVGADAALALQQAASGLVAEIRTELTSSRAESASLRADLANARLEIGALRTHIDTLSTLLRQRNVPVPQLEWPPVRNGGHVA